MVFVTARKISKIVNEPVNLLKLSLTMFPCFSDMADKK